ncbi:MAG: NAD-dependent epimerase/dehydratase family protein, partial [Flavobacteriaceae bacterium]
MEKKKVGITGQKGFVGDHLYRTLALDESVEIVPFKREFFDHNNLLEGFVAQCDVIVHLAAMNRHEDQNVIYKTNLELVTKLISACESQQVAPHILFSSSTQEEKDNLYGKSKKEGKEKLMAWAAKNQGQFTSLTIPNVFGPFGKPNYNSVVATFCHKIARNETPEILNDGEVALIYVNELVQVFINVIKGTAEIQPLGKNSYQLNVLPNHHKKVSEILSLLQTFKSDYMENGVFPNLE